MKATLENQHAETNVSAKLLASAESTSHPNGEALDFIKMGLSVEVDLVYTERLK